MRKTLQLFLSELNINKMNSSRYSVRHIFVIFFLLAIMCIFMLIKENINIIRKNIISSETKTLLLRKLNTYSLKDKYK